MKFPIDVLYLDANKHVVHVEQNLKPWRVARVSMRTASVLELPGNTLKSSGTVIGDEIEIALGPAREREARCERRTQTSGRMVVAVAGISSPPFGPLWRARPRPSRGKPGPDSFPTAGCLPPGSWKRHCWHWRSCCQRQSAGCGLMNRRPCPSTTSFTSLARNCPGPKTRAEHKPGAPGAPADMRLITVPRQSAWRVANRFAKKWWTLPS